MANPNSRFGSLGAKLLVKYNDRVPRANSIFITIQVHCLGLLDSNQLDLIVFK